MGNSIEDFKICIKQALPKDAIAGDFLLIISIYSTLLAIVEQTSTKEALKDADNQMLFDINEEITNATVTEISSPILWNCRDYSMTKRNYKNIYITLLVITIIWIVVGVLKIPYICTEISQNVSESSSGSTKVILSCLQFLSNVFLRISLIFLITSFDTDPWACIEGPSNIEYISETHSVDLSFPKSVTTYQLVGPILAIVLGIVGLVIGVCVSEVEENQSS